MRIFKKGFYGGNSDKITFDEAENIVGEYLSDNKKYRTYIKTRDVCRDMDISPTMHNKVRIHDALEKECEPVKKSNGTRFRISGDKR